MCPHESLQGRELRGGPPPLPREGSCSPLPQGQCWEDKATASEKALLSVGQNLGWVGRRKRQAGQIGSLVGCFFFHAKNSLVLVVSQEGFKDCPAPLGLLLELAPGQPPACLHPQCPTGWLELTQLLVQAEPWVCVCVAFRGEDWRAPFSELSSFYPVPSPTSSLGICPPLLWPRGPGFPTPTALFP